MQMINVKMVGPQTLAIKPKFEYYLPKDEKETIDLLMNAAGGNKAILSQETAVTLNPLVSGDPKKELKKIEDESAASQAATQGGFGGDNNPGGGLPGAPIGG
jgi:hypothetical protein